METKQYFSKYQQVSEEIKREIKFLKTNGNENMTNHNPWNAENYTFSSSAHGTFYRKDHILGHKSNFSKFKKTEIISSIFSDHNAMRLDISYKKKTVRNTSTWRFHNTSLNNQQATEDKKGNQKYSRNK